MEQRDFDKEAKEYRCKKISKNKPKETLSKEEHRLIVEEAGSEEMLGVYDNLRDLEIADLCDCFALERRNGGI